MDWQEIVAVKKGMRAQTAHSQRRLTSLRTAQVTHFSFTCTLPHNPMQIKSYTLDEEPRSHMTYALLISRDSLYNVGVIMVACSGRCLGPGPGMPATGAAAGNWPTACRRVCSNGRWPGCCMRGACMQTTSAGAHWLHCSRDMQSHSALMKTICSNAFRLVHGLRLNNLQM